MSIANCVTEAINASPKPLFLRLDDRLGYLIDRAQAIADAACRVRSRTFGAYPTAASDAAKSEGAPSADEAVNRLLDRLGEILDQAHQDVSVLDVRL